MRCLQENGSSGKRDEFKQPAVAKGLGREADALVCRACRAAAAVVLALGPIAV